MSTSLFTPLAAANLTSMTVQYDWKSGSHKLSASREWPADRSFASYGAEFTAQDILTSDSHVIGTQEVTELFAQHGLTDYLDQVLELVAQGRHHGLKIFFHSEKDIRFICHQHSLLRGLRNKRQATLAGGIRRHEPSEPELEVIIDGLNLGRAMTFKNIAADLDFGGCKTTVQMPELDLNDMESLGFLAYCIDRSRTMTGPDMNFPTAMSDIINNHFSAQFTNGPSSPLGESGTPTAYGTYLALKEAVRFREGTASLDGKSVAVMGLGAVGWHLAELLAQEDVALFLADMRPEHISRFKKEHPNAAVEAVSADEVLFLDVDVICPAAVGGIISEDIIDRLNAKYIFGPANNQLRASSEDEEIRLAELLEKRGILFQTEWWYNTAGVMCGAEEYINGASASREKLYERIEATIPQKTRANLIEAQERGITPTENAYRTCHNLIYGDQ